MGGLLSQHSIYTPRSCAPRRLRTSAPRRPRLPLHVFGSVGRDIAGGGVRPRQWLSSVTPRPRVGVAVRVAMLAILMLYSARLGLGLANERGASYI